MTTAPLTVTTSVRIVPTVDDETARRFYRLYVETFGELAVRAVNRHVLREDEFMEVMDDPRVDKYLVYDDASGDALAMCTLTRHLETVTWVSPEYFAHHYPDHAARNAIYYLGFSLVGGHRRRVQLFTELISRVSQTLLEQDAMCAYDICQYNNETIGLADAVGTLIARIAVVDVKAVDTQTYYTAVPVQGGRSHNLLQFPAQRPTV